LIDLSKIEIVDFHCHPATRSVSNLMNIIDIGALETILPISVTEDMRRAGGESIVKVEVSSEESEKLREKVRSYEPSIVKLLWKGSTKWYQIGSKRTWWGICDQFWIEKISVWRFWTFSVARRS